MITQLFNFPGRSEGTGEIRIISVLIHSAHAVPAAMVSVAPLNIGTPKTAETQRSRHSGSKAAGKKRDSRNHGFVGSSCSCEPWSKLLI